MSQATRKPKHEPQEFHRAVARLKEIAAKAGDSLILADGPVSPDHELLDLCAELAERWQLAEAAREQCHREWKPTCVCTTAEMASQEESKAALEQAERSYSRLLRKAAKLPATTDEGVYTKALAIRASKTGAAALATSLADDLLDNPALRRSIWPTETESGGSMA